MNEDRTQVFFSVDEIELRTLLNKGKDLYSAISELTGLPRWNVKKIAYGIIYSISPDKLKDIAANTLDLPAIVAKLRGNNE